MPFNPHNFAKSQAQQPSPHSSPQVGKSNESNFSEKRSEARATIDNPVTIDNQITTTNLENLIRQQFSDIVLSKEVINNIILEYDNLVLVTISIQRNIEKNKDFFKDNNLFEGWTSSKIRKLIFEKLELSYRHGEHENLAIEHIGEKVWYVIKSFIVSDPFEEKEKQYIGAELERLIIDHNKINRVANLVSALIGIEAGKVFGGKLIQLMGGAEWIQVGIALAVNAGIFWALTVVTENRVRTNYYTKGERKWRWRPGLSLFVITVIKLICVLYAALGGALDFTSVDKRFLSDKYINNYVQEIEVEVDKQQQQMNLVDELYEETISSSEKNIIKEKLQEIKNPIIQMYWRQHETAIKIDKQREILRDTPEGSNEHNRAYHDGIALIGELESYRRAMESSGATFDSGNIEELKVVASENKQNSKNFGLSYNIPRPILEEERYYREAIDYLKNPKNSPTSFIEKYFISRYGETYTEQLLDFIKNKNIEDLPIGDKVHILQAKLTNESANKLIPSLFASAFVPLFLEIMSLLTLVAVFNAPRYKMLYSNRDFQDKIESLSSTLINYMQVKYQQIAQDELFEEEPNFIFQDKLTRPLICEEVWHQVILQRIKEGKSPSIESLVSEYTQQFYKLDKFKQQNLNEQNREN